MFADVSKEALTKRRILVNIESLVFVIELLISFINCAPEVASSISKQGAVKKKKKKKKKHICFNIKTTAAKWIRSILIAMFQFMLTQVT